MEKLVDQKHVSVLFCCGAKGRMEVLDLKSYERENEVEKKEISNNEGVMRSESEDSVRCCSCFSFLFPSGRRFDLFRVFGKKYEEGSQTQELLGEPDVGINYDCKLTGITGNSGSFGDGLINEFYTPVKHVDLPRPKGS